MQTASNARARAAPRRQERVALTPRVFEGRPSSSATPNGLRLSWSQVLSVREKLASNEKGHGRHRLDTTRRRIAKDNIASSTLDEPRLPKSRPQVVHQKDSYRVLSSVGQNHGARLLWHDERGRCVSSVAALSPESLMSIQSRSSVVFAAPSMTLHSRSHSARPSIRPRKLKKRSNRTGRNHKIETHHHDAIVPSNAVDDVSPQVLPVRCEIVEMHHENLHTPQGFHRGNNTNHDLMESELNEYRRKAHERAARLSTMRIEPNNNREVMHLPSHTLSVFAEPSDRGVLHPICANSMSPEDTTGGRRYSFHGDIVDFKVRQLLRETHSGVLSKETRTRLPHGRMPHSARSLRMTCNSAPPPLRQVDVLFSDPLVNDDFDIRSITSQSQDVRTAVAGGSLRRRTGLFQPAVDNNLLPSKYYGKNNVS